MLEVRRAGDRFVTRTDWLTSWHSFSYGPWYDASNVGFGPLVVLNHDTLEPGAGFDEHLHSGVDLVTYVVSGALQHQDSTGHSAVVRAGEVQELRSGSGVRHSERNASATEPVEYVQMWLRTEAPEVSYEQPLAVRLPEGHLDVVTSSVDLAPGLVHVYVVSGSVVLGDARLLAGDAVRADEALHLAIAEASTVLVWRLNSTLAQN